VRTTSLPIRRTGFTLLELMVSIAILGAVFGLVGAMWGQAGSWNSAIDRHADGLRVQRVLTMMKDQWADRRRGVQIGEKKTDVVVTDLQITFTTASPILFPDWPLVVATYRIEPERELGRSGYWRLVYEEARIAAPTVRLEDVSSQSPAWNQGHDPRGRPVRDRMVLLDGLSRVRFERFGRDAEFDDSVKHPPPTADGADESNNDDASPDGSATQDARSHTRNKQAENESEEEVEPGLGDTEREKLGKTEMWRPMEEVGYSGVIPAVRLVGEKDKESFACVFVILASR